MANQVSKKKYIILILVSFVLTLLVYKPIKHTLLGKKQTQVEVVPKQVFYANHIAQIINEHCLTCHRPNGAAPFSLDAYNKVFRKKTTIRKVVEKNIMPPWPADPTYSHFLGENILSDIESLNKKMKC